MKLVIPGDPISKARPKFSTRGRFAHAYDSQAKEVHSLRIWLTALINRECSLNELEGLATLPLNVTMLFDMPIADSSSEPQKNAKLWNLEIPGQKDLDNMCKFYWDLLNGILWTDDRQIVKLKAEKKYSLTPFTTIEINTIDINMDDETKHLIKLFSPDEMSQFYCDSQLLANAIGELEVAVSEDKYLFLKPVTKEIIRFAALYSKKLAKLAKLGDA